MEETPLAGKVRFPRPSWRVIKVDFDRLEPELRKRDAYDLVCATQNGDVYTLFLRLKAQPNLNGDASREAREREITFAKQKYRARAPALPSADQERARGRENPR